MVNCKYCANEVDNLKTHVHQFHQAMEDYYEDHKDVYEKSSRPVVDGDDGYVVKEEDIQPKTEEAFDKGWACPRCGNKNVKIKYDENSLPIGRECPKCGLGKESLAKEVKCNLCDYEFEGISDADKHMKNNHPDKKYHIKYASIGEADNFQQKPKPTEKEWDEDLKYLKQNYGGKWDGESFNNKVESFENLGYTQGDALKLAEMYWSELSTEVQEALESIISASDDDDGVRTDLRNSSDQDDEVDYNKIGESTTLRTKYECELCYKGFKGSESLAIHYNDEHAMGIETHIDGYEDPVDLKKKIDESQWKGGVDSKWLEDQHDEEIRKSGHPENWSIGTPKINGISEESSNPDLDLCTICHDGMKCNNLMAHAGKHWNTKDNWSTRGIDPEAGEALANEDMWRPTEDEDEADRLRGEFGWDSYQQNKLNNESYKEWLEHQRFFASQFEKEIIDGLLKTTGEALANEVGWFECQGCNKIANTKEDADKHKQETGHELASFGFGSVMPYSKTNPITTESNPNNCENKGQEHKWIGGNGPNGEPDVYCEKCGTIKTEESFNGIKIYSATESISHEAEGNPNHDPSNGQFTSGGGNSSKHADKSEKDLVKGIKGGSTNWKDWKRTENNEELYQEIERRNREIPKPRGGYPTIFRDDPDAVSKMEQKIKYLEDVQDYWKKIIKFPARDYHNHNQLGDAKWYELTGASTNLRDAKKKLEGIKAQQARGTQLVRKATYPDGKKRFYYSEEPKTGESFDELECPECNSSKIHPNRQKGDSRFGQGKYSCNNCGATFGGEAVNYLHTDDYEFPPDWDQDKIDREARLQLSDDLDMIAGKSVIDKHPLPWQKGYEVDGDCPEGQFFDSFERKCIEVPKPKPTLYPLDWYKKSDEANLSDIINKVNKKNAPKDGWNEEDKVEENIANEDGGYANFGNLPKEKSWSVYTVASDLWYFSSREEAEDYVKNFPAGTYNISPPRER